MKIAFIWQGIDGRYKYQWRDGLYAAMKILEKTNEVRYFDLPLSKNEVDINEFKPDVVLYWEAPCTVKGKDAENYLSVLNLPYKKALLFAGGPIESHTCYGFDLYFVESKVSEEEFEALGLPWKRAFGVNTQIMKPMEIEKKYGGILHATFAGWKRHQLFAKALGSIGLAVGRLQDHDRAGYEECLAQKVTVLPEQTPEEVAKLINESEVVVNTAEFWGGGQRCTLEGMACGVPVVVMKDSPKNREFVEACAGGVVAEPTVEGIREAMATAMLSQDDMGLNGVNYVLSKWTEQHYAEALLEGIKAIV